MQRERWLARLSLLGGVLVVLIGIIHAAFTPTVYRGAVATMPERAAGLAYFFAVMGLYLIFCGWLMIYASRALRRRERWAWAVTFGNGVANAVAGVGALAVGFRNPFVWLFFVISLALSAGALGSSRGFRAERATGAAA
jgi:hypothetical protein